MVATGVRPRDRAGREPTATVGFQPFEAQSAVEVLAFCFFDAHKSYLDTRTWASNVSSFVFGAVATRNPKVAARRDATRRSAESTSPPGRSSRSDDLHQCRRRCPRGSIRRTIGCHANEDRSEFDSPRRTPDVSLRHFGERCASNGVISRPPRARASNDGPIRSDTPPYTDRRESSGTFATTRSGDS